MPLYFQATDTWKQVLDENSQLWQRNDFIDTLMRDASGISLSSLGEDVSIMATASPSTPTQVTQTVSGQTVATAIPSARVFKAAAQSIASGANVKVNFDTEAWKSNVGHDNTTNNTRLTINTAGKYVVTANVEWAIGPDANTRYIQLLVNNATTIAIQKDISDTASAFQQHITTVFDFAVGNYVEVVVQQISAGAAALNINPVTQYSPQFSIARLGL